MINIIAVITLTIMCFLITEHLAMTYSTPQYFFMCGWLCSIATGFFINWFVKAIDNDKKTD
jgi:hypothetical protein